MVQTSPPVSLQDRIDGDRPDLMAACLLPHGTSIQSHSRMEACASVEKIFFRHRLGPQRDLGEVDFELRSCRLGTTSFNFIRYGVGIDVTAAEDEADRYVLVAPLSGSCQVNYIGRNNDVQPGGFIILKPGAPFKFSMSPDHSHIAIGIMPMVLKSIMARRFETAVAARNFVSSRNGSNELAEEAVLEFITFLCSQLKDPAFFRDSNPFSAILEQTFLTILSEFMAGTGSTPPPICDRTPAYVLAAEKFMLDNIEEEIEADDIVDAACVPMRTLYYGFKKYRGAGPLSWMRTERLKAARRALLEGRLDGRTVTEIANIYCNANLGRFSQRYYQQFGEYPSETLQRARGAAAGEE